MSQQCRGSRATAATPCLASATRAATSPPPPPRPAPPPPSAWPWRARGDCPARLRPICGLDRTRWRPDQKSWLGFVWQEKVLFCRPESKFLFPEWRGLPQLRVLHYCGWCYRGKYSDMLLRHGLVRFKNLDILLSIYDLVFDSTW